MQGRGGLCRSRGEHSQLLQISRETKRINQMIDSWSKSPSFDRGSGYISADLLLKGALDLQESLVMLEKLQRSSQLLTQPKSDFQSSSFRERKLPGRPETCSELKKVIREKLYRKNLHSNGGRARDFTAVDQEKQRAPNLIARLMGLEEAPPKNSDPSKKCLDEIIQSMKLKGLLGETLIRTRNPSPGLLEEPPIVVIKPVNLSERKISAIKGAPLHECPPLKEIARRKLEEDQKSEKPRSLNTRKERSQTKKKSKPVDEREKPAEERREILPSHDQSSPSPITLREERSSERGLGFSRDVHEVVFNLDHRECGELERESKTVVKIEGEGEEEEAFCRRLERDLRCNDGGAWNSGWAEVPAKEEARELVRQLENHLFNLLVLELVRN